MNSHNLFKASIRYNLLECKLSTTQRVCKTYPELLEELGLPMDLKSPNYSHPHNIPKQKEKGRVPH